ncbi:sensor histidine kinase [Pseudodonghicola flavimaris]|uniref:histidine kinase n=1 Tax=Pseudodonghicola flavimaris TaxID=3050036 RepID=A0ABT7F5B8_9RHOB|nr:PhnD/SsuA/transferrin family substrate-binding protein [Pseudodonghicola flavimaris]MDK3019804.1 PhnD/SsuA/transferrin family substrate-binding protein [Pseudodonghicola flavimaris]
MALGLAVVVSAGLAMPLRADPPLTIGVLDYQGARHSLSHWDATLQGLRQALPQYDFRLRALDIHALAEALAAGELDFVITNPGHYAELEYDYHISRIATAEGDAPVASTLVTAQDLEALGDLAGKRLAVVAPEAFGGFQVIWGEMAAREPGLRGRVELAVTGYPMRRAADALLSGQADAAVLRACMLEELQAADPDRYGGLHAFALKPGPVEGCAVSSPVYPGWPFAKARQTPADLAKQVAVALLSQRGETLWTVPLDYQPVHDLLRRLQIGPYARTGPVSLSDFAEDYRDWLIGLFAALAFWAIYSVRIETLVRRRTRALKEANAQLTREIAERQRAEEADRTHQRELEHVARLSIMGEMASSIAHELNQPLSAISNYAQGCLLRLKNGMFSEDDMQRAAVEISQQADRAAMVIRRIRAFVRKRESLMRPVDVAELLEECAALYEAVTNRAGVTVDLAPDDDLPPVMADRIQLQQVVLNLVQNAVDAMGDVAPEARQMTIRAARQLGAEGQPGLCISVRDRGHGMDAPALSHFAEPFRTTKPEGIGLGLALSHSIVEAHGGWMRAETPADGIGLRVSLWLPEGGLT